MSTSADLRRNQHRTRTPRSNARDDAPDHDGYGASARDEECFDLTLGATNLNRTVMPFGAADAKGVARDLVLSFA
jgi:hypothetical protein